MANRRRSGSNGSSSTIWKEGNTACRKPGHCIRKEEDETVSQRESLSVYLRKNNEQRNLYGSKCRKGTQSF